MNEATETQAWKAQAIQAVPPGTGVSRIEGIIKSLFSKETKGTGNRQFTTQNLLISDDTGEVCVQLYNRPDEIPQNRKGSWVTFEGAKVDQYVPKDGKKRLSLSRAGTITFSEPVFGLTGSAKRPSNGGGGGWNRAATKPITPEGLVNLYARIFNAVSRDKRFEGLEPVDLRQVSTSIFIASTQANSQYDTDLALVGNPSRNTSDQTEPNKGRMDDKKALVEPSEMDECPLPQEAPPEPEMETGNDPAAVEKMKELSGKISGDPKALNVFLIARYGSGAKTPESLTRKEQSEAVNVLNTILQLIQLKEKLGKSGTGQTADLAYIGGKGTHFAKQDLSTLRRLADMWRDEAEESK